MCETSFITVTGTQMQYLATNVRQDLGVHHPLDIRAAFEGVWLILMTWSSMLSYGKKSMFFHILKRNISKVCSIPPKFSPAWRPSKWQKKSKNHQKRLQIWHFLAISGGFLAKGTWASIFFLVLWPGGSIGTIIGMKKKSFEIFAKIPIFFW